MKRTYLRLLTLHDGSEQVLQKQEWTMCANLVKCSLIYPCNTIFIIEVKKMHWWFLKRIVCQPFDLLANLFVQSDEMHKKCFLIWLSTLKNKLSISFRIGEGCLYLMVNRWFYRVLGRVGIMVFFIYLDFKWADLSPETPELKMKRSLALLMSITIGAPDFHVQAYSAI